jgi:hypothetical protein
MTAVACAHLNALPNRASSDSVEPRRAVLGPHTLKAVAISAHTVSAIGRAHRKADHDLVRAVRFDIARAPRAVQSP